MKEMNGDEGTIHWEWDEATGQVWITIENTAKTKRATFCLTADLLERFGKFAAETAPKMRKVTAQHQVAKLARITEIHADRQTGAHIVPGILGYINRDRDREGERRHE